MAALDKLKRLENGGWVRHTHARAFSREKTSGPQRLRIGLPAGTLEPLLVLLPLLGEPIKLLYVLHTPRGGSQAGRYESPSMPRHEVTELLDAYSLFLTSDARHDLWLAGPEASNMLVWDRHDIVYAYGALDTFEAALRAVGFEISRVDLPSPHKHSYHAAHDGDERALLAACSWQRTELQQEDAQ